MIRVSSREGRVIVDGVNVAKKHKRRPASAPKPASAPCRAASSTRTCRSTSPTSQLVCTSCGKADRDRLPRRRRRRRSACLPQVRGGAAEADRRPTTPAGSSSATTTRSSPSSRSELGLGNVMQVPRLEKIVINMGVGRGDARTSLLDGAVADLTIDHRPEADRHQGQEVDRRLQAPRGQADRRQGHPARRPHVGVLDRLVSAGHPPHPRLPRADPTVVRRPRQLHVRPHRAADLPGDRLRQDRHGRAAWTSRSSPPPRPTTRAGRCSTPSASRSGPRRRRRRARGQSMAKKALDQQAAAQPKFKVRGYTRCRRCGRPRRCTASSGCAGSACASWPTPARSPA